MTRRTEARIISLDDHRRRVRLPRLSVNPSHLLIAAIAGTLLFSAFTLLGTIAIKVVPRSFGGVLIALGICAAIVYPFSERLLAGLRRRGGVEPARPAARQPRRARPTKATRGRH